MNKDIVMKWFFKELTSSQRQKLIANVLGQAVAAEADTEHAQRHCFKFIMKDI